MTTKKRTSVIGRGLSSLLESPETDITSKSDLTGKYTVGSVSHILISQIEMNPFQPRVTFDDSTLQELAGSIKLHGVIQPITLRKMGYDKYQLITGERRFRASIMAGLKDIPSFIRIADDEQMLEWALIENIHRENLNPMDIALSYQRLVEECNLTQEELSQKVNSKRTTVTNYMRLLKLPDIIQLALKEEKITMGHARAIAAINDAERQASIFEQIIKNELSVREVEKLAKQENQPTQKKAVYKAAMPPKIVALKKYLNEHLSAKVDIQYKNKGKGNIVISFNSEDELNKIVGRLK